MDIDNILLNKPLIQIRGEIVDELHRIIKSLSRRRIDCTKARDLLESILTSDVRTWDVGYVRNVNNRIKDLNFKPDMDILGDYIVDYENKLIRLHGLSSIIASPKQAQEFTQFIRDEIKDLAVYVSKIEHEEDGINYIKNKVSLLENRESFLRARCLNVPE